MMDFSKNDFSKARVGDRVFDVLNEWGKVTDVYENSIRVWFPHLTLSVSYSFNGRHYELDYLPRLYWNKIHFEIPEQPKRMVKKEIKVWVALREGKPRIVTLTPSDVGGFIRDGYQVEEFSKEIEVLE